MSSSQDYIDRFNKYKSMADAAASACIRTFLHLVRPTEGFPYYSNQEIQRTWVDWRDAEEVLNHMTGAGQPPTRVFPTPPPDDAEHAPCRRMWGCLVQAQVEDQSFQAPLIKGAVTVVMESEACKSHPASCACKVPNNPWTWHECVAVLEPLNLKHNPKCQCGGYQVCKQEVARKRVSAMMASAEAERKASTPVAAPAPVPLPEPVAVAAPVAAPTPTKSAFDYKHNVDTCACGTCHKARVDSGTADAYMKRCRENTKRTYAEANNRLKRQDESFRESCPDCKASARGICVECHVAINAYDERHYLRMPSVLHAIRQAYHLEEPFYNSRKRADEKEAAAPAAAAPAAAGGGGSGFAAALNKASMAILVAAAKAGGIDKPDFAKELFVEMGTPHDSKCPHGLPFYACMPCSH